MEGNTLLCYFMEHGLWVLQPGMCGVEITEFQIYEISCVGLFHIFIFYEYILLYRIHKVSSSQLLDW